MKPYEKFLEYNPRVREILDIYLLMRQHFQELGFSQKDLENPPLYTESMMNAHGQIVHKKNALLKQIKDYGFDINDKELDFYLGKLFNKIDKVTPLSHANYKRRDKRDEDY